MIARERDSVTIDEDVEHLARGTERFSVRKQRIDAERRGLRRPRLDMSVVEIADRIVEVAATQQVAEHRFVRISLVLPDVCGKGGERSKVFLNLNAHSRGKPRTELVHGAQRFIDCAQAPRQPHVVLQTRAKHLDIGIARNPTRRDKIDDFRELHEFG